VLDWELTGPASPLYDTGHLAWFTVPLMDDARARARGFPHPPGRPARLDAFARGTGLPVSEVLAAALAAQQEYARRIIAGHEEPWTSFQQRGLDKTAAADSAWTRVHFRAELA
jgi:aminoglycoside phosphotransferase (APT) family kinase protein